MDKILAFSILSSSPADLSAASGFSTRLSWRTSSSADAAGARSQKQQQQQPEKTPRQEDKAAAERRGPRPAPAAERKARFAPEFDGINCFESIVSF